MGKIISIKKDKSKSKEKPELIYLSTAAELLGITPYSFRKLGLEPTKMVTNPHYSSASKCALFDKKEIEALHDDERVVKFRKRRKGKIDWNFVFTNTYGDWRTALPVACEGLFNLNRYVKHVSCSKRNKEDIYSIKNRLIRVLYENGYCIEAYIHTLRLDAVECWNCDGSGEVYSDFCCQPCAGTGIFKPSKIIEYYVLRFHVDGQNYTWHQPKEQVNYPIELTNTETTEINDIEIKEVFLNKSKFSQTKKLINWTIVNSKK